MSEDAPRALNFHDIYFIIMNIKIMTDASEVP